MAHCLDPERADKIFIDHLGLESLPVEILDALSLIDLHEVPKRTRQTYGNRNSKEKVMHSKSIQRPYQVDIFGEEYTPSREYRSTCDIFDVEYPNRYWFKVLLRIRQKGYGSNAVTDSSGKS
jgi:hypothetical protein